MIRSRLAAVSTLALASMLAGCSVSQPAQTSVATSLHADVAWLADDARQGRGDDTPGLAASSEYIAGRFRSLGLQPLPTLGTYFDAFNRGATQRITHASLAVNGVPLPEDAFTTGVTSPAARMSGSLAFVGYGLHDSASGDDDLAGVDLRGRIALVMIGARQATTDAVVARSASMDAKIKRLSEAGANAVIFVQPGSDANAPLQKFSGGGPIPVFWVTPATADRWLGGDGSLVALRAIKDAIDATHRPHSKLVDNVMISTRVETESSQDPPIWNVVGLLPGHGPHAKEYVVVGAHYDHLGRHSFWPGEKPGVIHHGADDNASGTATMLALAERFAREGPRARSVVFVAFTLEERGLVGSDSFVRRHVLPEGSIVAMLNLDMIGRMKNERLYVAGGGTAEPFALILRDADAHSPIELQNIGLGGGGPSDHASFDSAKIPTVFFFTGLHPDYHRPSDTAEKVNYDGLAQIASLAGDVVESFCTMDRPTYDNEYDAAGINVNVQTGEIPTTRSAHRER